MTAAEVRFCEGIVVTSESFGGEGSRWAFEVKGKPVKPVRSTLDIECLTGILEEGMNDPEVTMPNALKKPDSLPMKELSKLLATPSHL